MEKEKDSNVISKLDFYRLVSQETDFTIKDVKEMWKGIEKVIGRILVSGKILKLGNFMKAYVKETPPSDKPVWDNINKKWYRRMKPYKTVYFSASSTFRRLVQEHSENEEE